MNMSIDLQLSPVRKPHPPDPELGFGRVFTDHMFVMQYERGRGWHDARVVPHGPLSLDPATAVFHYGQAMFEGMKAFRAPGGRVQMFRPERHCERMAAGAPRLCMPSPDPRFMQRALATLIGVDHDWVPSQELCSLYIRPTLIATDAQLGVRASNRYTFFVIISPVGPYFADGWQPLRIWVEDRFVRAAPGGLGAVKASANYAAALMASEEARARGYSQVLWLDALSHRTIEEVGTMNLFARIADELITAPLEGTILGGVTRDSVLTLARSWGLKAVERKLTMDQLIAAQGDGSLQEVFGCGTASVIAPVGELGHSGGKLLIGRGQPGELSRKLYDALTGIQHGTMEDRFGWMVEVPKLQATAPRVRLTA
ncbi:MAG TPA: branched-chain amino acid aminotransferase [Myxococcales bacterium]|jgi:branched-chain amino acid aminotransferase|nr:branched-chain amino acid aminotransferase [Myxococcales bacterium]